MLFVHIDDLNVLLTKTALEAQMLSKGISPPANKVEEVLKDFGYHCVDIADTVPEQRNGFKISVVARIQDGKYVRKHDYVPLTIQDTEDLKEKIREKRDSLLVSDVDSVSVIRWESFTEEQKTEWSVYRQALLNIPQQVDFPFNINWPTKPAL
jgi:hypothetical protein